MKAYHFLGSAGSLPNNVELLEGTVVHQMLKTPRHSFYTEEIASKLRACIDDGWFVRQEQPLTFLDSEPQPDVALVIGWRLDWSDHHPVTADLVIEIATPSAEIELIKVGIYADNVEEYWFVLPEARSVEVYTEPRHGAYTTKVSYSAPQTVVSKQVPKFRLNLEELFLHEHT